MAEMSKVEEVARALCAQMGEDPDQKTKYHPKRNFVWEHYIAAARAAIEAMREPTVSMYVRGDHEILSHLNSEKIIKGEGTPAVDCWHAMIDTALSEEVAG